MPFLAKWKDLTATFPLFQFVDSVSKGYGQVLVCLNPLSGVFLSAAILFISPTVWFLTLVGVLSGTLTAWAIKAKPLHIEAGVYGFNGCVLGIAWLWFLRLNVFSILLLTLFSACSSIINKFLIDKSLKTRTNLPVFSVPALILIWIVCLLLSKSTLLNDLSGPDWRLVGYWRGIEYHVEALKRGFALGSFFEGLYRDLMAAVFIYFALRVHSRIALRCCLAAFFAASITVMLLGGLEEFKNLEFYMYNTIPSAVALGGTFLVFNRKVFFTMIAGVALIVGLTFLGLRVLPFPAFVAPFNLVTIALIWFVKSGRLNRGQGFFGVPMDLVSTPEFGLDWHRGEIYAENYWQEVKARSPHEP